MNTPNDKFAKFGFDTDFFEFTSKPGSKPVSPAVAASVASSTVFATPVAGIPATGTQPRAPRNVKEALEAGYAEGFSAALTQAEATFTRELEQLHLTNSAAITALEEATHQVAEELTRQTMTLVRATLHRLIGHAAENYPDQLLETHLKDLVSNLATQDNLTLRISPQARTFHEKLALTHANIQGLPFFIKDDPSLRPTDCVAEWKRGGVEAKVALHLEQLDTLLAGAGAVLAPIPAPATPASPLPRAQPAAATPETPRQNPQAQQLLDETDELVDALK